ncbi:MAG: hypothetical protein B6245_09185 [Desulfobacteraceae bacterium 4572_88]|nr:MAG: hypothetical protein B6245_09185 [Desulfobacteraceae bacterium 4572_88]
MRNEFSDISRFRSELKKIVPVFMGTVFFQSLRNDILCSLITGNSNPLLTIRKSSDFQTGKKTVDMILSRC